MLSALRIAVSQGQAGEVISQHLIRKEERVPEFCAGFFHIPYRAIQHSCVVQPPSRPRTDLAGTPGALQDGLQLLRSRLILP
jgi:hypothetical protein